MVYQLDLTNPDYFWQLRNIERKEYGKTTNINHTVRRVERPSNGEGQSSTFRSKLRIANVDVRFLEEGSEIDKGRGNDIFGLHKSYRDYGG